MRTIASTLALALLSSACAAHGRTGAIAGERVQSKPIPSECAEAVERARRLGEIIFFEDKIAWWATDALLAARFLPDKRVKGWVSTRAAAGMITHFLGHDGDEPDVELYRVEFRPATGTTVTAADARPERVDPPIPPSDEVAAMFKARQTAVHEPFRPCTDAYNTVVLPAQLAGESGWLVYLLAATRSRDVVFGGHIRRLVSADGASIVKDEPLSKSCLQVPLPESREKVPALVVTSLVSSCPLETHVFLSLLHARPIYLGNAGGTWKIQGTRISFLGKNESATSVNVPAASGASSHDQ
jgi:hypothetical protein